MGNHIEVTFTSIAPDMQEMVIANLAEAGYEGFEENESVLKAFIPEEQFEIAVLNELALQHQLRYTSKLIAAQNWNAVWESNFQPVVVDDFVAVRADFHTPITAVVHDIVITPKMSFGTGHHATTFMMLQQMRDIDFTGKSVFDFGTGTGVLAILATQLGASSVLAVDNDDWSIENAKENFDRNKCSDIDLKKANDAQTGQQFDIILANINKNVILDNMTLLASSVIKGGILLLSGLLQEDEEDIVQAARASMLSFVGKQVKENWLCLRFAG